MDEKARAPYDKKHEVEKALHEKRMAEREKKGFFLFEDGTKSTDPANKNRVAKDKATKKKKDKVTSDDTDEEDNTVKPKRAASSYNCFLTSYKLKEGESQKDLMKIVGEKWKTMDDKAKAPYEKLAE